MSKPLQERFVSSKQIASASATITTTNPAEAIIDSGLPVGDEGIFSLTLRARGNLNLATASAGSIVSNGHFINLRNLRIESDKHGVLYNNIDGLALMRLLEVVWGTAPDGLAISAATTGTPAFDATWHIPIAYVSSKLRPYDTLLDMLKSRLTVRAQFGIVTDFISGGTYSTEEIQNLSLDCSVEVLRNPNPVDVGEKGIENEMPILIPSVEVKKFDVTSTTTGHKFDLPFGDRLYRRVIAQQRNSSTLIELATVITATQNIGLEVNGFPWKQSIPLALLQAKNKSVYHLENAPENYCVLDFDQEQKIGNLLNTLDDAQGSMNIVADVTSVSNGALWFIMDTLKPIPPAARR